MGGGGGGAGLGLPQTRRKEVQRTGAYRNPGEANDGARNLRWVKRGANKSRGTGTRSSAKVKTRRSWKGSERSKAA